MIMSFRVSIVLLTISLFVVANTANICFAQNEKLLPNTDPTKEEAERIWEFAIEAKGGREKLRNVKTLFEIDETKYYSGFKLIKSRTERLSVLPSKFWEWRDDRPSVFGLEMTMYNQEAGKQYFAQQGQKQVEVKPLKARATNLSGVINILMETKWEQPIPEKLIKGKLGKQDVDIVQTSLFGERIDFLLDRKTHLPIKVISYKGEKISSDPEFLDYVDVQGIKMPTKFVLGGSDAFPEKTTYKATYQFNVEYNEDIFITPPLPAEFAADAWKVKK